MFGRKKRAGRKGNEGRGKEREVKKRNSNNNTLKLKKNKYHTVRQNEAMGYRLLYLCVICIMTHILKDMMIFKDSNETTIAFFLFLKLTTCFFN